MIEDTISLVLAVVILGGPIVLALVYVAAWTFQVVAILGGSTPVIPFP